MEITDIFIEIFFGAVGFFDFESVQGFGVDNSLNFVFVVDDGKISKTGAVEFIKS